MSRSVITGSTDESIRVWAYNSAGVAITGEAYNSAGIAVSVVVRSKGRIVSTTALTLVARSGAGVHTDSAFTEVGSGEYVIDLADSYFATANRDISVTLTSTAITGGYVLSQTLAVGKAAELDTAARTALLQAMVIEDTGETAASAGSVAKLAQANISATQLAAITVESGVIANFPETLTIGDSYTSNTGQIKIAITDADGDPITGIGSLDFVDATISFTAFRPNDSASISGICQFVDDITETYVLLTLPSTQTALGKAEYTYEGRLVFFWEGASSGDYDDEQKTYKTTPFKFIANP